VQDLAPRAVKVGNCLGRNLDKGAALGLTPPLAERVALPLVTKRFAIWNSMLLSPASYCMARL
jgi:hypothetical protein